MSKPDREQLVGLYLDGALDDEQRAAFDRALREDPSFAEAVAEAGLFDAKLEHTVGREAEADEVLETIAEDAPRGGRHRPRSGRLVRARFGLPSYAILAAAATALLVLVMEFGTTRPPHIASTSADDGRDPSPFSELVPARPIDDHRLPEDVVPADTTRDAADPTAPPHGTRAPEVAVEPSGDETAPTTTVEEARKPAVDRRVGERDRPTNESPAPGVVAARPEADRRAPNPWEGVRTGRFNDVLTNVETGERIMTYAAWVPQKLPRERSLGLVVVFHGFGSDENTMMQGHLQTLRRNSLIDRYVVVSGKSVGAAWMKDDDDALGSLIAWAKSTYPIDERRVIMSGISAGADYPTHFSGSHPGSVAAVIAFDRSGRFSPRSNRTTAYYLTMGDRDPDVDRGGRAIRDALARSKQPYVYREFDGLDHGQTWYVGALHDDIARWLDFQRNDAPPADQADRTFIVSLRRLETVESALLDAAQFDRVVRIGGRHLAKAIVTALGSKQARVRAAAARACTLVTFGGTETIPLARTAVKERDPGSRALQIAALGTRANWGNVEAQRALIALIRAKNAPSHARLLAVKELARASELPLRGNFEHGHVFQELVRLFAHADADVRRAAYAPFGAAVADEGIITVTDDFGYAPDSPPAEQKAAIAAWWRWFQAACAKP